MIERENPHGLGAERLFDRLGRQRKCLIKLAWIFATGLGDRVSPAPASANDRRGSGDDIAGLNAALNQ